MTIQRLFLLSPTTVFAARVNEPSGVTYPLSSVEFDTVTTGAYTDIKVGMTVLFGSSAGADDLGRKRIRAAADTDTIFIGRGSQGIRDGELNISDNDYITVLDDHRVWSKIPDIDGNGDIVKDEVTYTDQTSNIPPKANITGGWRIATIDSGTNVATFQFIGTGSYAVASGATISTYAWDVDDGTITVGVASDNTITATFPAGKRWVSLTVTDSNGKSHTMRVLVVASPLNHSDCVAFECAGHRRTADGQQCSFRILEDIAESTYPDGTAVIFWEGEPASASDTNNVKFWGWHQTDENTVTAERNATLSDITLTCLDVAGRLDTIPGFPESVFRVDSPSSWLEMAGLDMVRYIDYLLRWHSTAFENAYYVSAIPSGYDMVAITSDGESIWDQTARMAQALEPDYRLTCDRNGQLRVDVDPLLQDTGDRTSTSQATITAANWLSAQWQHIRPPRFHWNWGEAVLAYTTGQIDVVFCVAPGFAPGQGLTEVTTNFILTRSQAELNATEGHRYAYMNSFTGQMVITLAVDNGINPADMTWVTLTVDDAYSRRALGFSSVRFLPVEVNISYEYRREGLVKTVELILEEETSGTPAVTYEPPGTDWEWTPPPVITPPPVTVGDGFGTVYVLANDVLGRTRDLSATSPSWANISPSGTYTHRDFILDPWSPKTTGYHLSTAGVNKSTDLDQVSPTWSLVLSEASILSNTSASSVFPQHISCSINIQDYVGILVPVWIGASGGGDDEVWYIYSTNGGTSWNYVKVVSALATGAQTGGSFDIVPHLIGGALTIYAYLDVNNNSELWKSTDSGASWSKMQTINVATGHDMGLVHCPYKGNTAGQIVYFVASDAAASNGAVFKSTDGGSTFSTIAGGITPNSSTNGVDTATQIRRMGLETYTQDKERVFLWEEINNQLYISTDGGDSWTAATQTGLLGEPTGAGGFPDNGLQYYVVTRLGIFVSVDGGESFINKTGDWSFGFSGDALGGLYFDVIVPDWTE